MLDWMDRFDRKFDEMLLTVYTKISAIQLFFSIDPIVLKAYSNPKSVSGTGNGERGIRFFLAF
ncbi:hypothetical protein CKA32_001096 [Geitlerinema sp. FC II]|nr:hypothetical protein CKA32_001096 [Geitlerinema sp. FC II]